MHKDRRSFLKACSLIALTVPFASWRARAADGSGKSPATAVEGGKRGLLFDASDLPRIRANLRDPRFASLWREVSTMDQAQSMSVDAEIEFLEHELRLTNHAEDMPRATTALERAAFKYAMNADPE